jgi:hypothetical protein
VENAGASANSTHTTPFWKYLTLTLRVLEQKVLEQQEQCMRRGGRCHFKFSNPVVSSLHLPSQVLLKHEPDDGKARCSQR